TPTRELAQQVTDSASKYGKHMRFTAASIVGGMPYRQQFRQLSRPLDMLIATPGRLMDIMERPGSIDLSHVEFFILDEADRMLDMGFIEDVEHIAMKLSKASKFKKRQTLLFSATLDARIGKLAKNLLDNPETIEITPPKTSHTQIEQRFYIANDVSHKNKLLDYILENEHIHQAIIFSATKRHADNFAKHLRERDHKAVAMHGDMKQTQRNRTLDDLRNGKIQFLVATDVAARGIDVRGISHVINYDLPRTGEDYTHRIGRTGRAGEKGIAITFALTSEFRTVQQIERMLGTSLPLLTIPGLEPRSGFRKGAPSTSTKSFGKKKFGKPSNPRFSRGGSVGNSNAPSRFAKSDEKPNRSFSDYGAKPDYAKKRRDSDSPSFSKPRKTAESGNSSRFAKPDHAAKPDYAKKRRDSDSPSFSKPRRTAESGNSSGEYVKRLSSSATPGSAKPGIIGLKKKKLGTKPTAHKSKRERTERS
ncbi:MAG: helicase-related protein, partial [Gammaproteobacteria bacterium]